MANDISKSVEEKMVKAIDHLKEQFSAVRTSRASASLVESILVDYYGTKTPLKQMAQIGVPSGNQILITPWDKNSLGDIESAIRNSELGLNPVNDGKAIRLTMPPMTEERRMELKKIISSYSEEAKISVRNARGEAWAEVQEQEKKGELTEDDKYDLKEELQKLAEKYDLQVDQMLVEKEKDILSIG